MNKIYVCICTFGDQFCYFCLCFTDIFLLHMVIIYYNVILFSYLCNVLGLFLFLFFILLHLFLHDIKPRQVILQNLFQIPGYYHVFSGAASTICSWQKESFKSIFLRNRRCQSFSPQTPTPRNYCTSQKTRKLKKVDELAKFVLFLQ